MSSTTERAPQSTKEQESDFLVVGLGGSAGAIEAFKNFFRNVSSSSGMAYVVVLHLSPDHESKLAEILQNHASIPVTQVQQRVRLEPNHVYVIPPNRSLSTVEGSLVLSEQAGFEERRTPIDLFFRTLADAHESRAVSVIVSGMGADGSVGLKRVKEHNGFVLVQDPAEAQFDAMPKMAIATGLVDHVLAAAAMPAKIIAYRDALRAATGKLGDAPLTPREQEILVMVAYGHTNKEIANTLGITGKTVETHKANLMEKLELNSRAALVRFALTQGWLE